MYEVIDRKKKKKLRTKDYYRYKTVQHSFSSKSVTYQNKRGVIKLATVLQPMIRDHQKLYKESNNSV